MQMMEEREAAAVVMSAKRFKLFGSKVSQTDIADNGCFTTLTFWDAVGIKYLCIWMLTKLALPSHPTSGEPQGFSGGVLTDKRLAGLSTFGPQTASSYILKRGWGVVAGVVCVCVFFFGGGGGACHLTHQVFT